MPRVFLTRSFAHWAKKAPLTDEALCAAIHEMVEGLFDADLGGGLVKKRIALPGRGKSGGSRTLVATNYSDRWFFVFGFAKTERANINAKELQALKVLAADLLRLSPEQTKSALVQEVLQEICNEKQAPPKKPHP
jgi:hypothetical protein